MAEPQPGEKYHATDEEVRELLILREHYWDKPLDAETMVTWTRKLKALDSWPSALKHVIEGMADRGDKWAPRLPEILVRHSKLMVEVNSWRRRTGR